MNTRNNQEKEKNPEENAPKLYYVHNDIVFITEYVSIDQEEPLEIIQCCVDVKEDLRKAVIASRY
jgi:hypothetical protein